jgi:hypothetical protein
MNDTNISPKDFSPYLFWDVDVATLDFEKHKIFVIRRVMEYGKLNDWNMLKSRFSMDEIKEAIISARSMDPKVVSFISLLTNVPKESFRCYTNQQSNPSYYGY